eukprot:Amastigsp_a676834_30.p5 type:complete len:134 gc:universal Amastigsp_a676834_30:78-479(+)
MASRSATTTAYDCGRTSWCPSSRSCSGGLTSEGRPNWSSSSTTAATSEQRIGWTLRRTTPRVSSGAQFTRSPARASAAQICTRTSWNRVLEKRSGETTRKEENRGHRSSSAESIKLNERVASSSGTRACRHSE